jgi:hypothetical protein
VSSAVARREPVDERALARAGRAGDPYDKAASGVRKYLLEQLCRTFLPVLDRAYGARDRSLVAANYLLRGYSFLFLMT